MKLYSNQDLASRRDSSIQADVIIIQGRRHAVLDGLELGVNTQVSVTAGFCITPCGSLTDLVDQCFMYVNFRSSYIPKLMKADTDIVFYVN